MPSHPESKKMFDVSCPARGFGGWVGREGVIFHVLFFYRRAKASNGDNGQDPWSHAHSPFEYPPSAINNLHGNLVYAPLPIFAMDQPLALTKNNMDTGRTSTTLPVTGPLERQQVCSCVSL